MIDATPLTEILLWGHDEAVRCLTPFPEHPRRMGHLVSWGEQTDRAARRAVATAVARTIALRLSSSDSALCGGYLAGICGYATAPSEEDDGCVIPRRPTEDEIDEWARDRGYEIAERLAAADPADIRADIEEG